MKKAILLGLFIFAVSAVYSQTGVIRELTGEVELKTAGSSTFTAAREGSTVARDTIISTGFRSTAIIVIGSTEITVRPLTRLTLAEIQRSSGTEDLNVNLQAGRVRVNVTPPSGTRANTTVQTPSATASVRGTEFDMGVDHIEGYSGKTVYTGKNGLSASITSGFKSQTTFTGNTTNPHSTATGGILPPIPGSGDSSDLGVPFEAEPGDISFEFKF
ncbi:MAG: FecR domain-containing protein [Treponema sp.]|nr:FecR domain-containing protein [Treponema sp.]